MSREKADIFLTRFINRLETGEFDKDLDIPFASRKLLLALVKAKINKKVETGGTPILSNINIDECISEVREQSAFTLSIFGKFGLLEERDGKKQLSEKWIKFLKNEKNFI